MLKCKICGKYYKHLGSHIARKHKILAKDYKRMFSLDLKTPLITSEIQEKKRLKFDRKKCLKNLNTKNAIKYRFKKGNAIPRDYFSEVSKKRALNNLEKMNNLKKRHAKCPICQTYCKVEQYILCKV